MITEKMTEEFVQKVQTLTSEGQLSWQTIPEFLDSHVDEPLRMFVIDTNKYSYSEKRGKDYYWIDEYRSFAVAVLGGVIVLFSKKSQNDEKTFQIVVQESEYHDPVELPCVNLNDAMKELSEIIQITKGDPTAFINHILAL